MTQKVKNTELTKRIKTFAWSLFWVTLATIADHSLSNLGMLNLPTVEILGTNVDTAIVAGLVLNQVSKLAFNMRNKSL